MALINCPECGKEISDSATTCIHCGYPIKKEYDDKKNRKVLIILIVSAVIVIGIIAAIVATVFNKVNKKNICKIDGCYETVYTNGYCLEHYGEIRNGKSKEITDNNISTSNEESVGFAEDEEKITPFSKDSKISTDSCEFTLKGYTISNIIEPPDSNGSYYHYFESDSGNVFVDVKFSIKNKSNTAIQQDEIFRTVKIYYDDEYEYKCSFVTVNSDGDFENFTNLYDINPLETMEYHFLAELPEEVKKSGKSLLCQVEVDGEIYECRLR